MTAPFISIEDLADYTSQDLSGSDLAMIACDAACERVRGETDQQLNWVEDDEVVLDGSGKAALQLPQAPVFGTVVVLVDGVEVEATDYVVRGSAALLIRTDGSYWPLAVGNIAVTYSHGWAVVEGDVDEVEGPQRMPSDLRAVALRIAAATLSAGSTGIGGVSSETIGGYSYQIATGGEGGGVLADEDYATLGRYRIAGTA